MEDTVIDQINQLEDEKQQLIGKAREEAMATITRSLETLSELGYHYRLVAKKKSASKRKPVKKEVTATVQENSEATPASFATNTVEV
jgi:vacuolar-type H+-ATPase subunit H